MWRQLGNNFLGSDYPYRYAYDFPVATAINDDGTVVILGNNGASTNMYISGTAMVFAWSGSDWVQRGSTILGDQMLAMAGQCVAVSSDGNTIAVGGMLGNGGNGSTKVFTWSGEDWLQRGEVIQGTPTSPLGSTLGANHDLTVLAIGAPYRGTYVGVFDWSPSSTPPQWARRALVSTNAVGDRQIGSLVALSRDGNVLALTDSWSSWGCRVGVFVWDVHQRGDFIDQEGSLACITMNGDGTTLAIGINHDVQTLHFNGTTWGYRPPAPINNLISSISLSDSGDTLAVMVDSSSPY